MASLCGELGRTLVIHLKSNPSFVVNLSKVHALGAHRLVVQLERCRPSASLAPLFRVGEVVSATSHHWHMTHRVLTVQTVPNVQDAVWGSAGYTFVSHKIRCWTEETPEGPVLVTEVRPGHCYVALIRFAKWEDYWKANSKPST